MTHLQIIVLIPQCCKLFFAAERDTIVDWNEIFAMLNQLLTNSMTTEVIFLRLQAICEPRVNPVVMREYYTQKFFYRILHQQIFTIVMKQRMILKQQLLKHYFSDRSVTLHRKARIEYSENTDLVFNTVFGNTTKHVAENETKPAQYDYFDTIMITLAHVDIYICFLGSKKIC